MFGALPYGNVIMKLTQSHAWFLLNI